jgi:membrane-associated protease RseP (regulator of RpoE activity)
MANAPNDVHLFEVNLISDQVSMLLRRRAFQQLSGIAAAVMLVAGVVLAILMTLHMITALHMRSGTQIRIKELADLQKICTDLDNQRESAKKCADAVAPLLPIARQRMAWAPKLAAAAAVLPPGTGILNLQATQRDVFVVRAPAPAPTAPKSGAAPVAVQDEAGLPQIAIAILYRTLAGGQDNLGLYAECLKKDATFMNKFDSVHLVAMEQDSWDGKPVEVLHIHAQGNPK